MFQASLHQFRSLSSREDAQASLTGLDVCIRGQKAVPSQRGVMCNFSGEGTDRIVNSGKRSGDIQVK